MKLSNLDEIVDLAHQRDTLAGFLSTLEADPSAIISTYYAGTNAFTLDQTMIESMRSQATGKISGIEAKLSELGVEVDVAPGTEKDDF